MHEIAPPRRSRTAPPSSRASKTIRGGKHFAQHSRGDRRPQAHPNDDSVRGARLGRLLRLAGLTAYFVSLSVLSQVQATLGNHSANPVTFVADLTYTRVNWPAIDPLLDGSPGRIKQALGQLGVHLFLHGQSPWWNPFNGLGGPLASDLQSAVFYPFSLLVYGLHLGGTGPDLVALADVVVAGLGAYWLARELGIARRGALVTGTAFCLAGSFIWFGTLMGDVMAWTPASLAFTVRLLRPTGRSRTLDVVGLAATTALQMLGGFPESLLLQVVVLTLPLTVVALVRLARGRLVALLRVGTGFALGLFATALLWVPFVASLRGEIIWNHTDRALLHAPRWANLALIVPYAFGHWFDTTSLSVIDWYQLGGYVGAGAAWLAVMGAVGGWRKRRWTVAPFAASVVIALLCITMLPPVNWLARLPGLGRVPVDRLSVAPLELAVAVLAGLAVTVHVGWRAWLGATAFAAGGLWALVEVAPHGVARGDVIFSIVCLAVVALGLPAFQNAARLVRSISLRRVVSLGGAGVAVALVAVELLSLANLDYWNLPLRNHVPALAKPPAWVGYVRTHLDGGRLYAANNLLVPNYSGDVGIKELSFQDAVEPRRTVNFIKRSIAPGIPTPEAFGGFPLQLTVPKHLRDLELAGVTLLALPDPGCQPACGQLHLRYLDRASKVGIFAVPQPQPQLWFPRQVRPGKVVPNKVLRAVTVTAPLRGTFRTAATARALSTAPNRTAILVHTEQARLLVLRQVSFTGWRARINGTPEPILTVDGVLQGVEVPAGASTVTVSYTPPGLRAGEILSLLSVVLGGAAGVWSVLRRRRDRQSLPGPAGLGEPPQPT